MKNGIDISEHQGKIDWNKVKNSGIEFAIIRLGWIGNKNNHTLDKYFKINYENARKVGIKIGTYVYNYCNSLDTLRGAIDWVKSNLQGLTFELPVFLDMEDSSIVSVGKTNLTIQCLTFCSRIKNELNLSSGVYANKNWFTNMLDVNQIINQGYKIWLAEWNGKENHTANFKVDLWQYSSNGNVNGIVGRVDMNKCLQCEETTIPNYLDCKAHVENEGWLDWVKDGELIGTVGKSQRLEAIILKGKNGLDLSYRVHIENIGWSDWVNNGEIAGTVGKSLRIEAIEIKSNALLEVKEQVESIGWLPVSTGYTISIGTVGKSLRLEAFKIEVK